MTGVPRRTGKRSGRLPHGEAGSTPTRHQEAAISPRPAASSEIPSSAASIPIRAFAGSARTTTSSAPASSTSPACRSSTAVTSCTGGRSATSSTGPVSSTLPPSPSPPPAASTPPRIRHHDGRFWLITTNVPHGGNLIVTAERSGGPVVRSGPGARSDRGIDPDLAWDEEGTCWCTFAGIDRSRIDPTTGARPWSAASHLVGHRRPVSGGARTSTTSATGGTC